MGGGSQNSGSTPQGVGDNFRRLGDDYPVSPSGYLGNGPRNNKVTQHMSPRPAASARDVFRKLSKGGSMVPMNNGKGWTTRFPDGSRVVLRLSSSSDGTPTIDIFGSRLDSSIPPRQKVHFMEGHP